MKALILPLSMSLILMNATAHADAAFDRDLVRRSFKHHSTAPVEMPGIVHVSNASQIDFSTELSREDLETIESSLLKTYGHVPAVRSNLAKLFARSTQTPLSSTVVVFYLGVDVGMFAGIGGQVGLAFGRLPGGHGKLAVVPITGLRLSFLDIGVDASVGLGFFQAMESIPGSIGTAGSIFGGAYFAGGAFGLKSDGTEFFIEAKAGMKVQMGAFMQTFFMHRP